MIFLLDQPFAGARKNSSLACELQVAHFRQDSVELVSDLRRLERISVELVSDLRRLKRISVELVSDLVSGFLTKTHFGHEMASRSAVWAENLRNLNSRTRGIRLWHSRGLVPFKFVRKITKPIFEKIPEFHQKIERNQAPGVP